MKTCLTSYFTENNVDTNKFNPLKIQKYIFNLEIYWTIIICDFIKFASSKWIWEFLKSSKSKYFGLPWKSWILNEIWEKQTEKRNILTIAPLKNVCYVNPKMFLSSVAVTYTIYTFTHPTGATLNTTSCRSPCWSRGTTPWSCRGRSTGAGAWRTLGAGGWRWTGSRCRNRGRRGSGAPGGRRVGGGATSREDPGGRRLTGAPRRSTSVERGGSDW